MFKEQNAIYHINNLFSRSIILFTRFRLSALVEMIQDEGSVSSAPRKKIRVSNQSIVTTAKTIRRYVTNQTVAYHSNINSLNK